jgi:hypothetical protein
VLRQPLFLELLWHCATFHDARRYRVTSPFFLFFLLSAI